MLSVVIATKDDERALVPTLGALVPGAAASVVREVILADGGSQDQTLDVGDVAGCRVIGSPEPLGGRLSAAVAVARSPWVMFLRPGVVLDATWIEETTRFVETVERTGHSQAAAFRAAPRSGAERPMLIEALSLFRMSFGLLPNPDQGLLISKALYQSLGGHTADGADPEGALLRRLGRRRIVLLRSAATRVF